VTLGDRTLESSGQRQEIWDFGGAQLGAVRVDDFKLRFYHQRFGWPNEKATTDMPNVVNLRQDSSERTPSLWRFVEARQKAALAETLVNFRQ
jgi:hypothetical protein